MGELSGKKFVLLLEHLYHEHEFWYPKYRLLEAGATVVVAGTEAATEYRSKVSLGAMSDIAFTDMKVEEFDAVLIPGGFSPDYIRRSEAVKKFLRVMDEQGKLIAFICHAGWVPISAGILKGRKAASLPSIKDDMVNAGADWTDEPVVIDRNMISSRSPVDLPHFMKAVVNYYK